VFERIPADQIIIQQLISTERPVLSVCSFSVGGSMVGTFAYEKLRQHPNEFGTGTYLRSVHPGALHSLAEQVLTTLQYTGISEIEFIQDSQTGGYKIIEMNPRPWKSIHFASQCGANLIEKYISHVANGPTDYESTYACGQYWVDLATDIPQLARELKWPCYQHGLFECTWDWNDPLPALALWTLFPLIALEDAIASFGQVT
jgi:predicted ATP-grasp superfamily ATP-dependent carboligase